MDTRGKIIQRLRYVPTILWVILAFLLVLGVAAYVSQDNTAEVTDKNQQNEVATENGEVNDGAPAGGEADSENGGSEAGTGTETDTEQGTDSATGEDDEEAALPSELAAAGPVEDAAAMIAVTSTLGVLYLGSRKRLHEQRKNNSLR